MKLRLIRLFVNYIQPRPFYLRYPASVPHSPQNRADHVAAGLCAECLHSRRLESDRGSVFYLCELSDSDRCFPKYPRLPVLSCDGFKKKL